jgi:type III secretion system FlhB-like substrate exporter
MLVSKTAIYEDVFIENESGMVMHIKYNSLKHDAPYVYDIYEYDCEDTLIEMADEFDAYIERDSNLYDILSINCCLGEEIPDFEYARIAEIIASSLFLKGKI